MFHLEIKLDPQELLGAWHPETSRLVLSTPAVPPARQRAALRMAVGRPPVTATVIGTAVSVSRNPGGANWLELSPDADSMAGLRLLLQAARGEPVLYLDRPQRWMARLPVVVSSGGAATYLNTFSVSERGCGLVWSGPAPTLGQGLDLRFGSGPRTVEMRGMVCWSVARRSLATVGVQFSSKRGAPGAWSAILADASRNSPKA